MLEIIVVKKDALQIVDDYIDCPVGGVPDLFVISAPGCPDPDQHEIFFELWKTGFDFMGDGFVDHPDPVLLHIAGQLLPCRQGFRDGQHNRFLLSLG